MDKCEKLALKAGDHLYMTIETLEELCVERAGCKMSYSKYRRLATELKDLAKVLKTFRTYDNRGPSN